MSTPSDNRRTNLIVNYLPQSMTDENFRVLFAKHGDIRSARIIRNKNTGYSYGFGFVDYFRLEDAERAIESLNGVVLGNKKIKVSFARPSSDEIKNANLYVTNMPANISEKEVRALFSQCGEIIQCRLLGNRLGSAFILFNLNEQAKCAIKMFHQQLVPGTTFRMSVKFATNEKHFKQDNKYHNSDIAKKRPFAKNNPPPHHSSSHSSHQFRRDDKFASNFSKISGPIRSTSHNNRYNPLSPQTFAHPGHEMAGPMYPSGGPPRMDYQAYMDSTCSFTSGPEDEFVLFVYNIGPDTNEFYLGKLFSYYGTVVRVNVIRRGSSRESRGYGFVTMRFYQDALNAIAGLNGYKFVNNKPLQVSFKRNVL